MAETTKQPLPSGTANGGGSGDPGMLSSARSFNPPVGSHLKAGEVRGYYIDFTAKADAPDWPPRWLAPAEEQIHVATAQFGLGCYERYLAGEGEVWLAAMTAAADHLLDHQEQGGTYDGFWLHRSPMPHTYHLPAPWPSAMAQGESASLMVRLWQECGEERYADAARRAIRGLDRPTPEGGLRAPLGEGFFLEEYPTDPPSLVLNGGIFALWGYYDAGAALDDELSRLAFDEGADALADNLWRWDTGRWSLYDLFPHPLLNVASSFYHVLHTTQLRAMHLLAPDPRFEQAADRFDLYSSLRRRRYEAFVRKAVFRLAVPRNSFMAARMPFGPRKVAV